MAGEVIRRLTTKTGPSGEGRHSSFPIRTVDKIRMRVRCTCTSSCDRTGSKGHNHHHLWHQCVWLHVKGLDRVAGERQAPVGAFVPFWHKPFGSSARRVFIVCRKGWSQMEILSGWWPPPEGTAMAFSEERADGPTGSAGAVSSWLWTPQWSVPFMPMEHGAMLHAETG